MTKSDCSTTGPVQGRHLSISVVIAWVNSLDLLIPGLEALLSKQTRGPDEVIIATRHDKEMQSRLRALYPSVIVLSAHPSTPVTALRSLGIRRACGTVIVVTEDHCVPSSDWVSIIEKQMMHPDCRIVGGPVENGSTTRLRDWAAFLTEYADFVPASAGGFVSPRVPGNNVAYRRELCDELCAILEKGLWESFYYQHLVNCGIHIAFDREMLIYHSRTFDFWYFVEQRYHFCRSFAAMRCDSFTVFDRMKYGAGSLVLPPVLVFRGLMTLLRKRRLVWRYLFCLPLIGIYMSIGALGEMMGYFLGGGNSLARVE
jgi:glycosyl transferase family 2